MDKEILKIVKNAVKEGYKLNNHHSNSKWKNALESLEELVIKNK